MGLVGLSSSPWGKISIPQFCPCYFIYPPAPTISDPFSPAKAEEAIGVGPTFVGQEAQGWGEPQGNG